MAVRKGEPVRSWSVVEAKGHLHEVIEQAEEDGPQVLERHRDDLGVVVSPESWTSDEDRRRAEVMEGSLVEFFQRSGLGDFKLELLSDFHTVSDLRTYDIFQDDTE